MSPELLAFPNGYPPSGSTPSLPNYMGSSLDLNGFQATKDFSTSFPFGFPKLRAQRRENPSPNGRTGGLSRWAQSRWSWMSQEMDGFWFSSRAQWIDPKKKKDFKQKPLVDFLIGGCPPFSGDSSLFGGNAPPSTGTGLLILGQHYSLRLLLGFGSLDFNLLD